MENELELRGPRGFFPHRLVTVPTASGGVLLAGAGALAGTGSTVLVWDPRTGEPVAGPVDLDAKSVMGMALIRLAADRRALVTCVPHAVALWDLDTFGTDDTPLRRYDVHYAWDMCVVPATDTSPELLVTAEKDLARVIDPGDGATVGALRFPASREGTPGNRVLDPTGVRFGDGTAGFAAEHDGRLEVWRLDGRELTGREFGLDQRFRGTMTYLPGEGGRPCLAVAVGRGIEVWDLDGGRRLARGELDIPITVLEPVPLAGRTLVAAAFGKDRTSGVLLWDPATRRPLTGLFNQHGPAWGDPKLSGVSISDVIAVPYPDGTVRIASAGNDGAVRVSPPVEDLLARGAEPVPGPAAGGNFALVRDRSGDVVGIWLASMEHVRNDMLIEALLYKEDLTHLMGRQRRVMPNTVDDRGGAFVLFEGA